MVKFSRADLERGVACALTYITSVANALHSELPSAFLFMEVKATNQRFSVVDIVTRSAGTGLKMVF